MGRNGRGYPPGRTVGPRIGPGPVPPGPTKTIEKGILEPNATDTTSMAYEGFSMPFGEDITSMDVKVTSDNTDVDITLTYNADDEVLEWTGDDLPFSFIDFVRGDQNDISFLVGNRQSIQYEFTVLKITTSEGVIFP